MKEELDTITAKENICRKIEKYAQWKPISIPGSIPQGDMPGDKIIIDATHITRADTIFPELMKQLQQVLEKSIRQKAVIAVCGGSGVGKSEIASLLSYYFNEIGMGSYTLSGDNYPHRIPKYNDAERLRIFRSGAIRGLIDAGEYSPERFRLIQGWQSAGEEDANPKHVTDYPWFEAYLRSGRAALDRYLGTADEIGFEEVSSIVAEFKQGAGEIWLRRMGREETELWYEKVDFSRIQILIIEWTHGNSDHIRGVDIPILLHSTPQETLAHRRARNRDGRTDSAFTTMVLEIEQSKLIKQAHKAKLIVSKTGELLSYEAFRKQMEEG